MKRRKKLSAALALLLSAALVCQGGVLAFAADEDIQTETGQDTSEKVQTNAVETTLTSEAPDEAADTAEESGDERADDSESVTEVTLEGTETVEGTCIQDDDLLADNDELTREYLAAVLGISDGTDTAGNYGESDLTGMDKTLYTLFKGKIAEVADATVSTSTEFSFSIDDLGLAKGVYYTAEDLGVNSIGTVTETTDGKTYNIAEGVLAALLEKAGAGISEAEMSRIMSLLCVNCPYELYWYDKTKGFKYSYKYSYSLASSGTEITKLALSVYNMTVSFSVASGYQDSSAVNAIYTASGATAATVQEAKAKAESIVSANVDETDYNKLLTYKNEICSLASYNDEASGDSYTGGYGDPWQLIYVFDGNEETSVVCEGYTKAFQYLCDLTEFTCDSVCCYTVTGTLTGGTGSGGHMWNIVTMEDDKNYLIDVTNSDTGTTGEDGTLFLAGATPADGVYSFTNENIKSVCFAYDDDTKSLYGTGSDSVLTLATSDYENHTCTDGDGDGLCDRCGIKMDRRTAKLAGYSLSLSGNIGVDFCMELSEKAAEDGNARMVFTLPDGSTQEVKLSDVKNSTKTVNGKTYYVFTCTVYAKNMTDEIKAQMFFSGDAEGTIYTYTVQQYADYLLTHTSENADYAKAADLVRAMLNYGAYAQQKFDYNTENLANTGYVLSLEDVTADKLSGFEYTRDGGSDNVSFYGANLVLLSKTTLKLYFKVKTGISVTFTVNGEAADAEEYAKADNETIYCVPLQGISSSDLDTAYTVMAKVSDTESASVSYSVMSYAYAALTSEADGIKDNTALYNTVKALYLYWQAADAYIAA